jgi:amidase
MLGRESILATNGPIAADRDSLELFMSIVIASKPWRLDPAIRFQPWVPYNFNRPLKIAVQWWDGVVKPHPPMIRALREVSEACRLAGMHVVDWNCEDLDHRKGWEILSSLYFPDGGREVLGLLEKSGEPVLPLTKWIITEQPKVRDLDLHETWRVRK